MFVKNEKEEGIEKKMAETIISLSRMNCGGCVRNVTKALQTLPGVEILQTNIPTKTVHLRYPTDQVSLEQMKMALTEAGYPVIAEQPVDEDQQKRPQSERSFYS